MKYSVWLQGVLGFAYGKTAAIFDRFGSALGVYTASDEMLYNSGLFTPAAFSRAKNKSLADAEKVIDYCNKNGIKLIAYGDKEYPDMLASIPDFPLVIYYKGILPDFNNIPSICIVGPRKCSDFGIKAAYSLSSRLSRGGMLIVSGGALGVDSAAHRGVIAEKGVTALIMPCGFGYDYLRENEDLRESIIKEKGCIITEFPPEYPVKKGTFQIRNRIMSALTLGTVIIEAGERSGALITANHALEQGKDVFVIPGNPTLPQYIGSNKLLRDGAKPLLNARDVFFEYLGAYKDKLDIEKAYSQPLIPMEQKSKSFVEESVVAAVKDFDLSSLSSAASAVYKAAPNEAFCLDELNVFCGYDASELMTAITELEILGAVTAVPGGRYLKVK
ncbi:MAG: DNA-protecting protein DprA [Ruminococcaceae bacterium]|nr:DNA-protecting protein DprA [Oscillospiraceae bacterium]